MRWSRYFLKTQKDVPAEAQIASHRFMLRAGLVRQQAAGIYSWLPFGKRVLDKIAAIVREEQNAAGAQEILMPTIQPAELWQESGRYDAYGPEMLRLQDRHKRDLLYGPTNEEMVTDLFRREVQSYKDLPLNLYHIQWKFRDEIRPRFGVMRGREFYMKDGYSFDIDEASAALAYKRVFISYLRTFQRLGLVAIPMKADTGPIGGDLSHEFLIQAPTGESEIFFDAEINALDVFNAEMVSQSALEAAFDALTSAYARTDETHEPALYEAQVPEARRRQARGIEVGHIFYFGSKYSQAMGAFVQTPAGERVPAHMGSYGIGVSRLVGGIIEASHDEAGIIWPDSVAPFAVVLVHLKPDDAACEASVVQLYEKLRQAGYDVLIDDRDLRPGAKFADADLCGFPWQLIVGPRGVEAGAVEVKRRASGERQEVAFNSLLDYLEAAQPRSLRPAR